MLFMDCVKNAGIHLVFLWLKGDGVHAAGSRLSLKRKLACHAGTVIKDFLTGLFVFFRIPGSIKKFYPHINLKNA